MTVESVSCESKGYPVQQRFLYADYSPFDDDRNVIEMVKEFVSLTGRLIKFQTDNERLSAALGTADCLRHDAKFAIKQLGSGAGSAMDWFRVKYPEPLATEFHTDSAALLDTASKAITDILGRTDSGIDEQHKKYANKINSQLRDNHIASAILMQSWLSSDYKNLPSSILSSLSTEIKVMVDTENFKTYVVHRSMSGPAQRTRNGGQRREKNARRLSYSFRIDTSELEFWNGVRKVSEFGITDVMLPVGMQARISEKLRKALSLGTKNTDAVKEPKFAKADDYYLLSSRLESGKTLTIQLVPDVAKPDIDLIEIFYDLNQLGESTLRRKSLPVSAYPTISYRSRQNGRISEVSDLLRKKEIAAATDVSKILLLGTRVVDKLRILTNPSMVDSRAKLELLMVDDSHVLTFERKANVEFRLLFELLTYVAASFAPYVNKLMEKSPVSGELILREEVGKGKRKEYSVRADDLKAQLSLEHDCGKMISNALQL